MLAPSATGSDSTAGPEGEAALDTTMQMHKRLARLMKLGEQDSSDDDDDFISHLQR